MPIFSRAVRGDCTPRTDALAGLVGTSGGDQGGLAGHRVRVSGQVQGVGFRPFVYGLARRLGLSGWVRNAGHGVEIEVYGPAVELDAFARLLHETHPPLAKIDNVRVERIAARSCADAFRILPSAGGSVDTEMVPDAMVCEACLAELFDPADRRYRYPFINCTHCGPRYTIARSLPYDRHRTSMGVFTQCGDCQCEYDNPEDRRFHAQPNACAVCGPRLQLLDADGSELDDEDPIAATVARLANGEIVAVKGIGGFHLVCRADHPAAVARLRQRKQRDAKPLAVMVASPAELDPVVEIDTDEHQLLTSAARPIVLLHKRAACDALLPGVAPGLAWLGVMLPCSPLHYLLFHEMAGRPAGTQWLRERGPEAPGWPLVYTSANPGGEPLVTDNTEAVRRLAGLADAYLAHDREIVTACDDSVVRHGVRGPSLVRRARGYVPTPIRLPHSGPAVLALGGWFKNTACVTRGDRAFVSQHVGDLDSPASCRMLEEVVDHLQRLFAIRPERVACDLHPDFHSSRLAADLAGRLGVPLIQVQHHHAHLAAVQAEHGLSGPVLGIAMDGVGLGTDHTPWGGELLRLDADRFTRLGHLAPLALPGGDRAAREPWRMAASVLHDLGDADAIPHRFSEQPRARGLVDLLQRESLSPPTTSLGRYFDAASGLLGVRAVSHYEGQAAMELEGLAQFHGRADPLQGGWYIGADRVLCLTPLLEWLAGFDVKATAATRAHAAAVFHATLAEALATWLGLVAREQDVRDLVIGGGCASNQVLARDLDRQLESMGMRVHWPRQVPPNDGGLSLGQAWVACCTDRDG
ncbi:carbamoyltransferase HypF [Thioalkalivibrio sp. ALJT]|uniref:carbamoyltransferase HypF n=1 Tax=Thioalkalivibrio sp. ALJT TaxID=1158146 RepID=UPI000374DF2B|nr:carbamoyltransferase HypF [Thioalkalivibrio sp. ALJT]